MKATIARVLDLLGYEMRRGPLTLDGLRVENNFFARHQWIQQYGFQTIIDIGANQGQFASRYRRLFPTAQIYSFEPITEVFQALVTRFEGDVDFQAFNFGLGEESGSFSFFQNEFSDSSSLLPMKNLHRENFPFTKNEKVTQIQIRTLDEVAESIQLNGPILIKIDVQGFEKMVIRGGENTLKKAALLIVEVSFQELYENQIFFDSIYADLTEMGFRFVGNYDQLVSPKNGSILQADALFINQNV